jgi:hypothetical protein
MGNLERSNKEVNMNYNSALAKNYFLYHQNKNRAWTHLEQDEELSLP